MRVVPIQSEASSRGARMLRTALGREIAAWLEDPSVVEIMLNPDGRLFVERRGQGIESIGELAPGAADIRQGFYHIGHHGADFRGANVFHRFGPAPQHRMAHACNLENCHSNNMGLPPSVVKSPLAHGFSHLREYFFHKDNYD